MPLAGSYFKNAIAYPVIEPPLDWLIASLLIWERVDLIWDTCDEQRFRQYASRAPVFYDSGLVHLAKPEQADVDTASSRLAQMQTNPLAELPHDEDFFLHPVKVTHKYWEGVRRSKRGFIEVPRRLGILYVGLLADEMATRSGVPALSTRIQEPICIAGGTQKRITGSDVGRCILSAAFEVLSPHVPDPMTIDHELIASACRDVFEIRKLDCWQAWQEKLKEYTDAFSLMTPTVEHVKAAAHDLSTSLDKFTADVKKRNWLTFSKVAVTAAGGIIGFLVGSVVGAIAGAGIGLANLGIDLFQARDDARKRQCRWEAFVLKTRQAFG